MDKKLKEALLKTKNAFSQTIPILIGILLLISLVNTLITEEDYKKIFGENELINSVVGAGMGSIATGNPITSYIIGGELENQGVSLVAINFFHLGMGDGWFSSATC
jgi:uncharacterized membrane protein YraQ (UPF0718 family)